MKAAYGNTDSFLARFGGDEFVVVASCDGAEKAEDVLQLFYDKLEESNRQAAKPLRVTLSAGYACYDGVRVNDRHSLMKAADEGMYREKQRKKPETACLHNKMNQEKEEMDGAFCLYPNQHVCRVNAVDFIYKFQIQISLLQKQ